MEKISLEEFRRLRDRVNGIVKLMESYEAQGITDYEDDLAEKYPDLESVLEAYEKISNYDLSSIPAEEYKGFYDIGINFEGTGATLDFNYIDISHRDMPMRAKGCNVLNFPFTPKTYDEDSFDPEVLELNQDKFLQVDLPKDVQTRYYIGQLTISDVIKYNLFDAIEDDKVTKDTKYFFEKVDRSVLESVNKNCLQNYDITTGLVPLIEEYDGDINEEVLSQFMKESIRIRLEEGYTSYDSYESIRSIDGIEEFYPKERLVDFKGNQDLYRLYRYSILGLKDVLNNQDMFRGKEFIDRFNRFEYQEIGYNEEQLYYILDNYPEVSSVLLQAQELLTGLASKVNLEETKEEIAEKVQSGITDIYSKYQDLPQRNALIKYVSIDKMAAKLNEFDRFYYKELREKYKEEDLTKYGIPIGIILDSRVLTTIHLLGIENIMEFDSKNGNIFTKNKFELLKNINRIYFHYGSNNFDSRADLSIPIQEKDMDELFRRLIKYGPTDGTIKEQPIDFRDFSDEFKNKYPELFISENAPEELKNLYYSKTVEPATFIEHPEWKEYFVGKSLDIGINVTGETYEVENHNFLNYMEMLDAISDDNIEKIDYLVEQERTGVLPVFKKFKSSFPYADISEEELANMTFERLTELSNKRIEDAILKNRIPYGEKIAPMAFKEKHPEMFIAEDAPEELKKKFYSFYEVEGENVAKYTHLTVKDWLDKDNYKYLDGKDLSRTSLNLIQKAILEEFSQEELNSLLDIDRESVIFYIEDDRRLNKFVNVLKQYPGKFAKESISEELKISPEELETRLANGDKDILEKFESETEKFKAQIIKSPGFVISIPDEDKSRKSLKEYMALSENNMLKASNRYTVETYSRIISNIQMFLGYDEARKLLDVPNIDGETLDRIYEQDELIKSLYEKKFTIKGDLKVVTKFIETVPTILPGNEKLTSKNTLKVFRNISEEIQGGYTGDIKTLLIQSLEKNNMPVDQDKVDEFVKAMIGISTEQKLDLMREKNAERIDSRIPENEGTRRMIKILYRNAMEYTLTKAEKIDPDLVKEYFEKEFSKVNSFGEPYYSEHVSGHLEEFVEMSKELVDSEVWAKKLNHSIVDDIRNQSTLIGKGWIRKVVNSACNQPEFINAEQLEAMENALYPEGSDIEIDAESIVSVKDLTQEEKEDIYKILSTGNYANLFTYSKAENMFSANNVTYSSAFREFFIKNKDEFISNPRLFVNFQLMNNIFDKMLENENTRSTFEAGKLKPDDVMMMLESNPYPTLEIKSGDEEIVYWAKKGLLKIDAVQKAMELYENVKKREYQTIPPEEATIDAYRGRALRIDDPRVFTVGNETHCCQRFGEAEPGESSMLHSATEKNGSEFVVEIVDEKGEAKGIMAQSWMWRNGNRVTFDNVEIPHDVEKLLKTQGGFDKIMDVYVEMAKKLIETDRKKLERLVEQGKITKEQAEKMQIAEVTMGSGCDDLIHNLSDEKRVQFVNATKVAPIEINKTYEGIGSRNLYVDSGNSLVLYENEYAKSKNSPHIANEVGDYGVRYYKSRDILRRHGIDIKQDLVDKIKNRGVAKEETVLEAVNPLTITNSYGIDVNHSNLNMSENGDWYVLFDKSKPGEYRIYESGVDQAKPETDIDKMDRKMALGEYTREMYNLFLEATEEKRDIRFYDDSFRKVLPIDALEQEGVLDVGEAMISVKDPEKLRTKALQLGKVLEGQRRDRILIPQEKKKTDTVDKEENEL